MQFKRKNKVFSGKKQFLRGKIKFLGKTQFYGVKQSFFKGKIQFFLYCHKLLKNNFQVKFYSQKP